MGEIAKIQCYISTGKGTLRVKRVKRDIDIFMLEPLVFLKSLGSWCIDIRYIQHYMLDFHHSI